MNLVGTTNVIYPYKTINQIYQQQIRQSVYQQLFNNHLKTPYQLNQIPINQVETIHTIFIQSTLRTREKAQNYYVSHGFGGSSIFNFAWIDELLKKGNVIFWEIRGMGFSNKLEEYTSDLPENILQFFLAGIAVMLTFYNHQNVTIISHSFGSYLTLAFTLMKQELTKFHIKQILLFSPIGITKKEEDYKFTNSSCIDCFKNFYHRLIWACNFNYKTTYRTVFCCCSDYLIGKSILQQVQLNNKQRKVMQLIIKNYIEISNGSDNLFFQLFQPRVLPKIALEPLITKQPNFNITMIYGGQKDWMDKLGATKISQRFPNKIKMIVFEDATHNIPFYTQYCKDLFRQIFK